MCSSTGFYVFVGAGSLPDLLVHRFGHDGRHSAAFVEEPCV